MNAYATIYRPPSKLPSTMSPGIFPDIAGRGFPIYAETTKPGYMAGAGLMSSLTKRARGVTGRIARRAVGKMRRTVGKSARRTIGKSARGKLSALKKKIGASLKRKVSTAVKKRVGGTSKKLQSEINKKVNNLMSNPPPAVRKNIRNELSKEIAKSVPKRRVRSSINGGPSHNELVRQAERAIYSGANF